MIDDSEGQTDDYDAVGSTLIEVKGLRKHFPVKSGMFSKVHHMSRQLMA